MSYCNYVPMAATVGKESGERNDTDEDANRTWLAFATCLPSAMNHDDREALLDIFNRAFHITRNMTRRAPVA